MMLPENPTNYQPNNQMTTKFTILNLLQNRKTFNNLQFQQNQQSKTKIL